MYKQYCKDCGSLFFNDFQFSYIHINYIQNIKRSKLSWKDTKADAILIIKYESKEVAMRILTLLSVGMAVSYGYKMVQDHQRIMTSTSFDEKIRQAVLKEFMS